MLKAVKELQSRVLTCYNWQVVRCMSGPGTPTDYNVFTEPSIDEPPPKGGRVWVDPPPEIANKPGFKKRIRLWRAGCINRPFYHICVMDVSKKIAMLLPIFFC